MRKVDRTREKILKTTFLLLIEKGYDNVLVSDIQSQTGLSRGLLYRYYKNKSALVLAACREFFYDRYLGDFDYDNSSLCEFFRHVEYAIKRITNFDGVEVEMLKYNTLYSSLIQSKPEYKDFAIQEFSKARRLIKNAIASGEIKADLPDNFVGATVLAIVGRTSYFTKVPSNAVICERIVRDLWLFYSLIREDGDAGK
ncbi:MAG: TetR/AcrR family transcriptional regulator [Opitutales bacterium]|nr:TetR/AcrR family transcriptional regulator [Opitutales bacterium]